MTPVELDDLAAVEIDHVLIAMADLEASVADFERRYGLTSVEGGRHPGWGTANRLVPLGSTYLELIAAVDANEASRSDVGRWVSGGQPGMPLGWAARTSNIERIADRLGLTVHAGSRRSTSGEVLRWRTAGLEVAAVEPMLPFFIEWDASARFPGGIAVRHPSGATRIGGLLLDGDSDRVSDWVGGHPLPITLREGKAGIARVVIATVEGEIAIGLR